MGQVGISIVKRTAFRDATQEFANTYHYANIGLNPNEALAETLIDWIVTGEKLMHSSLVTFVHARCWSSGGTKEQNQMIFEKALSGVGSTPTEPNFDKERAYLIRWPAGTDTRGRPVYLRKWYHTCGGIGNLNPTPAQLENISGLSQAERDSIANLANHFTRIPFEQSFGLVAESGRTRSGGILGGDPPECHRYIEHHQLGDQWRG